MPDGVPSIKSYCCVHIVRLVAGGCGSEVGGGGGGEGVMDGSREGPGGGGRGGGGSWSSSGHVTVHMSCSHGFPCDHCVASMSEQQRKETSQRLPSQSRS